MTRTKHTDSHTDASKRITIRRWYIELAQETELFLTNRPTPNWPDFTTFHLPLDALSPLAIGFIFGTGKLEWLQGYNLVNIA